VILYGMKEFSIQQIAECGQAFRWNKEEDGSYTGVAFGKVINIMQVEDELLLNNVTQKEFDEIWHPYFDLDRDYGAVIESLKGKDEHLDKAMAYGNGIRLVNQELWEMIISYIISANNNIPRIKKSVELIAENFGDLIAEVNGKQYYSFPTPEQLGKASMEELRACGIGYRDKYIFKTTRAVLEGEVDLSAIPDMDIDEARKELKKLTGIADKVADCVIMFSCNKTNAFPVDTWVKKILAQYYGMESNSIKAVNQFANDYFGPYCGYAQQYLFYYIRETQ